MACGWASIISVVGERAIQIVADQLFYLQSRGLNYNQARDMLINAFLGEIISFDKKLDANIKQDILDNLA